MIATRRGDDYTTECFPNQQYFKNYQLISVSRSKQKELNTDPRAIQQIEFYEMVKTSSPFIYLFIHFIYRRYTILVTYTN